MKLTYEQMDFLEYAVYGDYGKRWSIFQHLLSF